MRHHTGLFIAIMLLSLSLGACGSSKADNAATNEQPIEQTSVQQDSEHADAVQPTEGNKVDTSMSSDRVTEDTNEDTSEGETVALTANQEEPPMLAADMYAKYCHACHGPQGEGTTIAPALNSTEVRGKEHGELAQTIAHGVPGTAMAGWGRVLDAEQINAMVTYIQQRDMIADDVIVATQTTPTPIDMTDHAAVMQLGSKMYTIQCASCHGDEGLGAIGPALNSQQFLTRMDDAWIRDSIISGGWRPDSEMPAFGQHMTRDEIESLVQFIRAWEPTAPFVDDPRGSSLADRGYGNEGHQGQGQGMGRGQGQGMGRGQGQGMGRGQGHMANATPVSYNGEVITVTGALLRFTADTGEEIEAILGPPWYWIDHRIAFNVGDEIAFSGFDIPEFYLMAGTVENVTTGETYQARTPEGMPLWRGMGMKSP